MFCAIFNAFIFDFILVLRAINIKYHTYTGLPLDIQWIKNSFSTQEAGNIGYPGRGGSRGEHGNLSQHSAWKNPMDR